MHSSQWGALKSKILNFVLKLLFNLIQPLEIKRIYPIFLPLKFLNCFYLFLYFGYLEIMNIQLSMNSLKTLVII